MFLTFYDKTSFACTNIDNTIGLSALRIRKTRKPRKNQMIGTITFSRRRLTGCDWLFLYLNIQKSFLVVPDRLVIKINSSKLQSTRPCEIHSEVRT